jgi:hypothetical protein
MSGVLDIIQEHCQWSDYNQRTTAYQVASVFHQRQVGTNYPKYRLDSRPRKWELRPPEVLKIRRQRSISLSHILCEESKQIEYPHPERLGHFNSWAEYLQK